MGMLAGVTNCRRSRKWGCRRRLVLGFKPRCVSHTWKRTMRFGGRKERTRSFGGVGGENHAALAEWGPRSFGERGEPRVFGVLPFAMWLRKQERLCLEEKG